MGLLSSPTVDLQLAPQTGLDTTSTTLQGVSARGSTMCMISHNVHDVLMSLKKRCASKLAGHMLLLALVESFWVKFNIRACTQTILLFLPTRFGSRPRHGFDHRYAHQSLAFKPKACRVLLPQPPTRYFSTPNRGGRLQAPKRTAIPQWQLLAPPGGETLRSHKPPGAQRGFQ